jgi:REP element-mobilizing transposase RayT
MGEEAGPSPHAGSHHARFIDPDVPLHIISRVFQGRHLLRPSRELNSVIAGVIGRAQHVYPNVRLYAFAFMSNHMHLMVQGGPEDVPAFIGFIKREISRRWGSRPEVNWPGTMWHEYLATALPNDESQVGCLKYILSQGVKEGLVARPQDWPGVHCARHLLEGTPLRGEWLDATSYSRARNAESRKCSPQSIHKTPYLTSYAVAIAVMPAWGSLSERERAKEVMRLVGEIEAEARSERRGTPPLGSDRVCTTPLRRRTSLPPILGLPRFSGQLITLLPSPLDEQQVHSLSD